MNEKLIDMALVILQLIYDEREKVREINKQLTDFDGGDFAPQISAITTNMETQIVALIDAILDPKSTYPIGSYWLYEGGTITVDGKEYDIKTIADVKNYVMKEVYANQ